MTAATLNPRLAKLITLAIALGPAVLMAGAVHLTF